MKKPYTRILRVTPEMVTAAKKLNERVGNTLVDAEKAKIIGCGRATFSEIARGKYDNLLAPPAQDNREFVETTKADLQTVPLNMLFDEVLRRFALMEKKGEANESI